MTPATHAGTTGQNVVLPAVYGTGVSFSGPVRHHKGIILPAVRRAVGLQKDSITFLQPLSHVTTEKDTINLSPSKCRFSTLKSKFPGAHIKKAFGTSRENRDYIMKDGKHPFDTHDGQDVLIFEEFRGGIKHGDMLNYLDGYPLRPLFLVIMRKGDTA